MKKKILIVVAMLTASFFIYAALIHGLTPMEAIGCAKEEIQTSHTNNTSLITTRCEALN